MGIKALIRFSRTVWGRSLVRVALGISGATKNVVSIQCRRIMLQTARTLHSPGRLGGEPRTGQSIAKPDRVCHGLKRRVIAGKLSDDESPEAGNRKNEVESTLLLIG